jgi:predicted O-methyltransferase YrrM
MNAINRKPTPQSILASMFANDPQMGADGAMHEIDHITRISPEQGELLVMLHKMTQPKHTLEIGCAYGFSTTYFLKAMAESNCGHHTIVDPFQHSYYHGIGLRKVSDLGMDERVTFVEEESQTALGKLWAGGYRCNLSFLDGHHLFENVLMDFYWLARITEPQGLLIFDDLWLASVQKGVAFVEKNRKDFARMKSPVDNAAIFRRVGDDTRAWHHFADF